MPSATCGRSFLSKMFGRKPPPPPPPPPPPSLDVLSVLIAAVAVLLTVIILVAVRSKRQPARAAPLKSGQAAQPKQSFPNGPMVILWGSQTGTAESFGKLLMQEARQRGYRARSLDLEEYDSEDLPSEAAPVIFLMATHGEGEPTDNAKPFYEWLEDSDARGPSCLSSVRFAAFGLGNRQYEQFNSMGKWVDGRMGALGAQRLCNLGLGDDDDNIEEDFENWREQLWATLAPAGAAEVSTAPEASFELEWLGGSPTGGVPPPTGGVPPPTGGVPAVPPPTGGLPAVPMTPPTRWLQRHFFKHELVETTLVSAVELCSTGADGSVKHMEILAGGGNGAPKISYEAADDLAVLCDNGEHLAAKAASALSLDLDASFRLRPRRAADRVSPPLPTPCTVRAALRYFADLRAPPSKQLLMCLAERAAEPAEGARLRKLASAEGKKEYADYVLRDGRGLVELLGEFRSCTPPLGLLLELTPKLAPRYYTISSSPAKDASTVHLTVKVLREPMKDAPGRTKEGICTTQLEALSVRDSLVVFVRPSHFRLPERPEAPVLMVGPGTGIAPFRAFLQQMEVERARGMPQRGHTRLYFGCRESDKDFLYHAELDAALEQGILSRLRTAFSREGAQKVYVQSLLAQDAAEVWPMLSNEGGHLYICGGTAMGREVVAAIQQMAVSQGGLSAADAERFIKDLQANGRLIQELWS